MISLQLSLGGNGAANFSFNSGLIDACHLTPPPDGTTISLQVNQLQPTFISFTALNGQLNQATLDITEGPDPIYLAYTIDCTGGGPVSVSFPGSPTVTVNPGSYLTLDYNNGSPFPGASG